MNELIKVERKQIGGEEINAVDARELHEYLESKQQFSHWIQNRVAQYEFAESVDFITIDNISYSPPRKEYIVSLDMAKELAMVEKNEKGKEARKYFIECEKKLRQAVPDMLNDPAALRNILIGYTEKVMALEGKIEEDRPKVELYDAIKTAQRTYSFSEAAKLISNGGDFIIGRNTLMALMRHLNVLMKYTNEPLQSYVDRGFFLIDMKTVNPGMVKKQTVLTGDGLEWLSKAATKVFKEMGLRGKITQQVWLKRKAA